MEEKSVPYVKVYYCCYREYGCGYYWDYFYTFCPGRTKKGNFKIGRRVYDKTTKKCLNFQGKKYVPEQFKRGFIEIIPYPY